ncbi:MAG TPA: prepilin-type N-terminal cleavage/methylation domain-containing protein [Trichocoleus sp.]
MTALPEVLVEFWASIPTIKYSQLSSLLLLKSRHSKEAGFTLIEVLVVIIIIGILAAIAWPAFLTQAPKAKQAKAGMALGSINRAQQAYQVENSPFANSLAN